MSTSFPAGMRRSWISPLRRLDHHRAANAHEGAGNGNDSTRFFRIQIEYGGDIIGIGKLLDGSSGRRHFHRRRHAQGNPIDEFDFVDDGNRPQQAIVQ